MFQGKINKVLMMLVISMLLSSLAVAADDVYSSRLVNHSKQRFKLIKSRMWPTSNCILDAGSKILNPGESTYLKIKKSSECNSAGIGYEMYKSDDRRNEHLIGYLSHRFNDGKFSLQISMFCEGGQCIFLDLNPQQKRGSGGE